MPEQPCADNDNLSPADYNRLFHLAEEWKRDYASLPYPWCYQPEICRKLGYCPTDPNCGE